MALTEDQKARRAHGLFSSDIGLIMEGYGVKIALQKLGRIEDDDLDQVREIKLGKLTEPYILEGYKRRFGCELELSPDTVMHPTIPWMGAHPDAKRLPWQAPRRTIVEAKTVGIYNAYQWGNAGTDQVIDYVLWQAVEQMACLDADRVDIAVCFMTMEAMICLLLKQPPPITIYTIERDFGAEDLMVKKSTMVWECIQRGETPPPENLNDVKLIWAKASDRQVEADDAMFDVYLKLMEARDNKKGWEDIEDSHKLTLSKYMEDASALVLTKDNQTLVTWKNDRDGERFMLKKFAEEYPELYSQYLEPKPGARKFIPKKLKEK